MQLQIHEMYASVQGEASHAGQPCYFIRTSGCDLRCHWCDTPQAFKGGKQLAFAEILNNIQNAGISLIQVTGGEPMLQKHIRPFLELLLKNECQVILETGGHRDFVDLSQDIYIVSDVKLPGSGHENQNLEENFSHIRPRRECKYVIKNKSDFSYALNFILAHPAIHPNTHWFSPVHGELDPKELVEWILSANAELKKERSDSHTISDWDIRLNLQQHKYIWDANTQGV